MRPRSIDRLGHLEHRRIAALPERRHQNLLSGFRLFQHVRKHQQRMRGPTLADRSRKIVAHLRAVDAAFLRKLLIEFGELTRQDEVIDRRRRDPRLLQRAFHRTRHNLRVAFVADPALFPIVVELLALATKMVNEVDGERMTAEEPRRHAIRPDQQRGRSVAELKLLRRARARLAPVA